MSSERYKTPNMAFALIFRDNKDGSKEILLQKRKGTGYMDSFWDASVAGHVEKNNSITKTIIEEINQELCITVEPKNLSFVAASYSNFNDGNVYNYYYFLVKKYSGEIKIGEKEKCADLKWFNVNNLPSGMIADREESIKRYLDGNIFSEFGWA